MHFFCQCLWVSVPLGGGRLGVCGGCEMGVFTLCALPTWRMLYARGQRLTFCTDHIHHYYHHCFSSNRAEHHIPIRLEPTKWENGQQFSCTGGKVRKASKRESGRQGKWHVSCINTKTCGCLNDALAELHLSAQFGDLVWDATLCFISY